MQIISTLLVSAVFGLPSPLLAWTSEDISPVLHLPAIIEASDGALLQGAWAMPNTEPKAIAVFFQGSGNVGMDGDVSGPITGAPESGPSAPLSRQIAEALAKAGIVSLRYDKRGYADPAQLDRQITSVLLSDALAAIALAKARFPGKKLILVGFSEGALIAAMAARKIAVDVLVLLSPTTRSIDEAFEYQFRAWPRKLLSRMIGSGSASIPLSFFAAKGVRQLPLGGLLPALGASLESYDRDHDHALSAGEIDAAYDLGWLQLRGMLQSPAFSGWYADFKRMQSMREFASEIQASRTIVYAPLEDAQSDPEWIVSDLKEVGGRVPIVRTFQGLGHCFSAMLGPIGEVKTSGPMRDSVLDALSSDVTNAL